MAVLLIFDKGTRSDHDESSLQFTLQMINRGFHKWGYLKMDGLDDWAVPPFMETPKPPYMNIDVKERMVSLPEMIYKPQFLVAFPLQI